MNSFLGGLADNSSAAGHTAVVLRERERVDIGALAERATRATSAEDRAECLADIEGALEGGQRAPLSGPACCYAGHECGPTGGKHAKSSPTRCRPWLCPSRQVT
jgi:hypothetical protein